MDLRLGITTHDIEFDAGGNMNLVEGRDRVAQQARIRFKFFQGEWLYDTLEGMPYYQQILGIKPVRQSVLVNASRAAILGIKGAREIYKLFFDYSPSNRRATVSWTAKFEGLDRPFVFDEPFRIV